MRERYAHKIQNGCTNKTVPKTSFFIKITISQYHNIDISYIDIDISKNAFSMTSLIRPRDSTRTENYVLGLVILLEQRTVYQV